MARTADNNFLRRPGIYILTPHLNVRLALGAEKLSSNALRDLMNRKFKIDLGIGNPSPDALALANTARYLQSALERYSITDLEQYGPTQGELGLRKAIAERYGKRGIDVDPDHVVIVNGAQEALALASMIFIDPPSTKLSKFVNFLSRRTPSRKIALEDPTYIGLMQPLKLRDTQFEIIESGNPESLSRVVFRNKDLALAYKQPTLNNPLTITDSDDHRQQDAAALRDSKKPLLEDQPYEGLVEGVPPLPIYFYAPDQTMLVGSMSKLLAPSLRVGWVVVRDKVLRDQFIQIKQGLNIATSRKDQAIAEAFLRDPSSENYLAQVRTLYSDRRSAAVEDAQQLLGKDWEIKSGGMYMTMTNPNLNVTTRQIADQAAELGLAIVPLEIFSPTGNAQGLRANVIYNSKEITHDGLVKLTESIHLAEEKQTHRRSR